MRLHRQSMSPYHLYLALECGMSFLLGISYATITVYWVTSGRLNPLQLLLLGTSLELSYFLFQLPTGVLADLVSRRLCVLTGLFIVGLAQVMQSLSPSFANLMAAQAVLGLGAALNNGAQDAWIADELSAEVGDDRMTGIYLRATQLGLIATVAGSLLSGVIALAGLDMPLRVGGALICLLAVAAAFVMPERNFRRAAAPGARRRQHRPAGRRRAGRADPLHPSRRRGGAGPGAALRHDVLRRDVERELRPPLGRVPAAGHQVPAGRRAASGHVVQPVCVRGRRARARRDRGGQAADRAARPRLGSRRAAGR